MSVGSRIQGCFIFVVGSIGALVALVLLIWTLLPLMTFLPSAEEQEAAEQVRNAVRNGAEVFGELAEESSEGELAKSLARGETGFTTTLVGKSIAEVDAMSFPSGDVEVYDIDADMLTITVIGLGYASGAGWISSSASAYGCAELTAKPGSNEVDVRNVECEEPVLTGIGSHWGSAVSAT
ncbi:hypothetical protein N1031_07380 [Herbiconiux moechotypicola]|uniref:Uncharacterized protein n=1 Tax=Herbiconiux moechotypicola TaxID=637393 RepID=A0ABN3DGZ4_9MICO|nr:hypothetical protein [Herbiconiux moechotypicola]MCS5729579.1 hypothetical protein [Herbiconiux moechotypicola]